MRFLVYLVSEEVLTAEQAIKSLDIQLNGTPAFGKLALKSGMLKVRQVMDILHQQSDNTGLRFGEMAVKMGFLTEENVEDLLALQQRQRPSLDQILVEQGYVDAPTLAIIRQRYQSSLL